MGFSRLTAAAGEKLTRSTRAAARHPSIRPALPVNKGGIVLLLQTEKGETLAELKRERTAIGRDPSNDLVLEDPSVSGFHAVVLNDRGVVSVVDLGSTNGTAMDGRRLRERTALKPWCRLQMGGVKLVVADTESREPTRVQPVVPAAGREGGPDATVQRTQVRPAAQPGTRVVHPPQPAGGIRFESLQEEPAGTRVSPSQPSSPPATRVSPSQPPSPPRTRVSPSRPPSPPPTRVSQAQAPSPQPRVVHNRNEAPPTDDPYALFGGYPRGLGWLLFSFRGRISRSLFWKCVGIGLLAGLALQLITGFTLMEGGEIRRAYVTYSFVYWLLGLWPWMAIFGKRFHDLGHRALPWCVYWICLNILFEVLYLLVILRARGAIGWLFLSSLPLFYALYLTLFKMGDDRDNQFGDRNPRQGIVFRS